MILFSLGFVTALVVIQFFPKASLIGAWIVRRGKDAWKNFTR